MSTTNEPESEEVTKKVTTNIIARIETILEKGKCSKNLNKAVATSADTAELRLVNPSFIIACSALFPKIVIQTKVNPTGTNNTPRTNSLIVLPLETRAINIPTKGAHAIHQAQ